LTDDKDVQARMIAGSIGMRLSYSGEELSDEKTFTVWDNMGLRRTVDAPTQGPVLDTIQPTSGWWIFEEKTEDDILREKVRHFSSG
jgi:hypothetical protein